MGRCIAGGLWVEVRVEVPGMSLFLKEFLFCQDFFLIMNVDDDEEEVNLHDHFDDQIFAEEIMLGKQIGGIMEMH